MKWLIDNWSFLIVILGLAIIGYAWFKKFIKLPSDQQVAQIKEWLLFAVIEAEKQFGSGTGVLKLRSVYDAFLTTFPALVNVVTFEVFSKWVDEVLIQMRHIIETNKDVAFYVEGE